MKITKGSIDLHWCQDGDFRLGNNGDIKRATTRDGRVSTQIIVKRLQSSRGDWIIRPELGATIERFAGQPNTAETGERIKAEVKRALMECGIVSPEKIFVDVVPTCPTIITILVYGKIVASNVPLAVQIEYDLRENKLIPRLV